MELNQVLIVFCGIMVVLSVMILWLKNGQDRLNREIKDLHGRLCALDQKQHDLFVRQNETRTKIINDEMRKK